ncbi:PhzF family phenazine biosynthesis protein [Marinobacterium sp. LSUCC0821]|uniref:PhzF family phenazine biosynthesis protein n=1 Tax=Marinobacterium sp. LSUCC0821 TaxID=2668067 RepID=UPI0014528359|nr:PhzF family phenazine biosynthesis protein [Marinobacterium sp. LSUCC0821]QJD71997.1 PhzF family phenazine biosynthesis protein [Marinobacterium sp. LSUCC0821]
MIIQHIAAFSDGPQGGNPAGVVLCDALPNASKMQELAAEIGYSESVFAAPVEGGWRVRFFSPEVEVDFCGHATIALGAELARQFGSGTFALMLNRANISVDTRWSASEWRASFQSPPTRSDGLEPALLQDVLTLFGLERDQLDPRIPPAIAHGGGDHLVLALKSRERLSAMQYDQEQGRVLALRAGLLTFSLVVAEQPQLFHARNPFPTGGVYEDPATGAAAAALAGYLRDLGWPHQGSILICQGDDMGVPSRLRAAITPQPGASIRVSGSVRLISKT